MYFLLQVYSPLIYITQSWQYSQKAVYNRYWLQMHSKAGYMRQILVIAEAFLDKTTAEFVPIGCKQFGV